MMPGARTSSHPSGSVLSAELREVLRSCRDGAPYLWPWRPSWWKPTPDDRVRELVKTGALIAAEIDRLRRRG